MTGVEKDFYKENEQVKNRSKEEVDNFRKEKEITCLSLSKHKIPNPIVKFDEIHFSDKIQEKFG